MAPRFFLFFRGAPFFVKIKRGFLDVPSWQLAHIAAVVARYGHDVMWSRGEIVNADVAIVLSSLVDHRHEVAWADRYRETTGAHVGFVGLAASKLPELFRAASDFVV